MRGYKTYHRKKVLVIFFCCLAAMLLIMGRLVYLMVFESEYYTQQALELHERERSIKAARGEILDRNGNVLASNKTVCTISVIHSQIEDEEAVTELLCESLGMDEETVRKKVEKVSSIEKIKSNVPKEIGDAIRKADVSGIKVDEDYKRYYPYGFLASKVLGFTGADNQGIIGLEVIYEDKMKGTDGIIYTVTDARGVELDAIGESRLEPVAGNSLKISLDVNIQSYATMLAEQVMKAKDAEGVSILSMNPKTGEIYACVNVPEFDLNDPFTLTEQYVTLRGDALTANEQDERNRMWRNNCINDTYEPGSTFKVITAAAGLSEGVVSEEDMFSCPGFCVVEDRRIRCHKVGGHGSQTFTEATMNSCNPVFVGVGLRLGTDTYYDYFKQFGLLQKTGIDLPGEANTIMHKKEDIGLVELATMSFGQSFQVTPVQLLTCVSSIINGGNRVTPHFGTEILDADGKVVENLQYPVQKGIVSEEISARMRVILEKVVSEGGGKNGQVEGYAIGGKTATSQTLPRGSGRYISSFIGFAPADDPEIITLVVIQAPKGVYYGGTIAAPVVRKLYENILPYMKIEKSSGDTERE
ncbi:MAG: peptidoglycan glycosyltransferase [Lachnospiraceae bacterium]|nr:peptidoglycan glycosyltransferase [Lachnospiraceae bacterium]